MGTNDRKRIKIPANLPKRQQHIACTLSDEEMQIVERYLNKYKIENKSRWFRETILQFVYKNMQEDYPTLFGEHDMRR
ncbi:hypothetical protein [uncultured Bacteroides sp.]|jgi:hypothetical protein|uniref:hypothetical protein n=1 Tax=uncultured Bacteroides sp. TaxID=162156 RepID=UPI002AAB909B|nr:hypothetical protein [uncultured Bacteroides sp.]